MTDDYVTLFSDIDPVELGHVKYQCYRKLYEIQKERAKHRGIRGMTFKLINLFNNDTEEKPVEEAAVVYKPEPTSDKQEEIDNKAAERQTGRDRQQGCRRRTAGRGGISDQAADL